MTSRYRHPRRFDATTANLIRAQEIRAMLDDEAEKIRIAAERLAAKLRLLSRPGAVTMIDVDLHVTRRELSDALACVDKMMAWRPRIMEAAE